MPNLTRLAALSLAFFAAVACGGETGTHEEAPAQEEAAAAPAPAPEPAPAPTAAAPSQEVASAVELPVGEHLFAGGGDCPERSRLTVQLVDAGYARVFIDQQDEENCGKDAWIFAKEAGGAWSVVADSEVEALTPDVQEKLSGLGIPGTLLNP